MLILIGIGIVIIINPESVIAQTGVKTIERQKFINISISNISQKSLLGRSVGYIVTGNLLKSILEKAFSKKIRYEKYHLPIPFEINLRQITYERTITEIIVDLSEELAYLIKKYLKGELSEEEKKFLIKYYFSVFLNLGYAEFLKFIKFLKYLIHYFSYEKINNFIKYVFQNLRIFSRLCLRNFVLILEVSGIGFVIYLIYYYRKVIKNYRKEIIQLNNNLKLQKKIIEAIETEFKTLVINFMNTLDFAETKATALVSLAKKIIQITKDFPSVIKTLPKGYIERLKMLEFEPAVDFEAILKKIDRFDIIKNRVIEENQNLYGGFEEIDPNFENILGLF
jgi:hypothetical protein